MSDKFGWVRGVLMVSRAPRCVMSCSLTGSVRRGDETQTSIPLWFPACVPMPLLNGICKVIFLMIVIAEEALGGEEEEEGG